MTKEINGKRASIDGEFLNRSEYTRRLLDFGEDCDEQHTADAAEEELRDQLVAV